MNSSWNDRIKNTEETPPGNGWDKIAASLDESFNGYQFPVTLYNLEANPPADTWHKINSALDEDQTPAIPLKKIISSRLFIRYAAAACLVGLLSFAAIKFFGINKIKVGTAIENSAAASKNILPQSAAPESKAVEQPLQSQEERDENALEQSKRTYAKLDLHGHNITGKIKRSLYSSPAQLSAASSDAFLQKMPELQYSHRAAVNDSRNDQNADRYLMFKDSEGRFIRISKKLTSLFCCVSGEEQDDNCTDQLKKWREKIASSSFIPSPDNFMDILDLVSSLQDTRN
ncbi:MAG: hypothetical protein WDO19_24155 [Bacteroidota bacterium]